MTVPLWKRRSQTRTTTLICRQLSGDVGSQLLTTFSWNNKSNGLYEKDSYYVKVDSAKLCENRFSLQHRPMEIVKVEKLFVH
jgi:hypothetical protein